MVFPAFPEEGAHLEGGCDEGGGLAGMDGGDQLGLRLGFAFRQQVVHLPPNQLAATAGSGEGASEGHRNPGFSDIGFGEDLKGKSQKGIANEDGGGFIESQMASGVTTTQGGVVHGREVVMHQAVGMQALNGQSGRHRIVVRGK